MERKTDTVPFVKDSDARKAVRRNMFMRKNKPSTLNLFHSIPFSKAYSVIDIKCDTGFK